MAPSTTWIDLDGVANMRDLGGLPTHDGRTTRYRRLIRSDNLQDLSPDDVRHLVEEVGVTDVVDLRTDHELEATGHGPLREHDLRHHHHTFYGDGGVTLKELLAMRSQDDAVRLDPGYWSEHYRGYLARRPDSVAAALGRVAHAEGAAVVHCAAGKDRTGTVVALALGVAGVPDEEIVVDYLLTAERIDRIVERLAGTDFYAHLRDRPLTEQTPVAEAMVGLLGTIADAGGAEEWLRAQGWTQDDVDRLRSRLLD